MMFPDREHAGRLLANALSGLAAERPLVIALPRGGVPVGYEIARALGAPLDVLATRKLGVPMQPELGFGAVAAGGAPVLNRFIIEGVGVTEHEIEAIAARERARADEQMRRFRGDRPLPDLHGRTVILVDDGLATGVTAIAAARALRRRNPARLVLAVPVASPEAAELLSREVDDVVCLDAPPDFEAVGSFYQRFDQISDDQVMHLLASAPPLEEHAEIG